MAPTVKPPPTTSTSPPWEQIGWLKEGIRIALEDLDRGINGLDDARNARNARNQLARTLAAVEKDAT